MVNDTDKLVNHLKNNDSTETIIKSIPKESLMTNALSLLKTLFNSKKEQVPEKNVNKKQLANGISTEREHTTSDLIAKEISLDHLTEDPKYYDHLEEMESKYQDEDAPTKRPYKYGTVFVNSKTAIVTLPESDFTGDTVQIHRIADNIGQYGNICGYTCTPKGNAMCITFKLNKDYGDFHV